MKLLQFLGIYVLSLIIWNFATFCKLFYFLCCDESISLKLFLKMEKKGPRCYSHKRQLFVQVCKFPLNLQNKCLPLWPPLLSSGKHFTWWFASEGISALYSRFETGDGEGCIRHDCRKRREAVPNDDEQESEPYQRQEEKIKYCSQVLSRQVSSIQTKKALSC